jgi:hypothetical protein
MPGHDLLRGLSLLESGDWVGAHSVAQADTSAVGSWLHGIVHVVEPDEGNARYWYQRAGRPFPGMNAAASERAALRAALSDPQ